MKSLFTVFLTCILVASALADDSKFANLTLPLGVSIKVPKNWRNLEGDANSTIETFGEAALNLAGIELPRGRKINLFRANSNPPTTYAGIAINATDSDIPPQELKSATNAEIEELSTALEPMTKQMLAAGGFELLRYDGARRETVTGHPALVLEYLRSGPKGPVFVQMTRLFIGSKEISLNLSYRESEGPLWRPIIAYIRQSFSVAR